MNKTHSLNIAFEDLFKLIIGLIVDDLKVHKHLHHLSLSGLDTTPLHLNLYKRIFILAGFKEKDISEELADWYFEQTKRVHGIDLVQDEEVLSALFLPSLHASSAAFFLIGLLPAAATASVHCLSASARTWSAAFLASAFTLSASFCASAMISFFFF